MTEVSFTSILADLSAEFGWQPDAWRRLTWRELQAWVVELGRRRKQETEARQDAEQRAQAQQQRDEFYRSHGIRR